MLASFVVTYLYLLPFAIVMIANILSIFNRRVAATMGNRTYLDVLAVAIVAIVPILNLGLACAAVIAFIEYIGVHSRLHKD